MGSSDLRSANSQGIYTHKWGTTLYCSNSELVIHLVFGHQHEAEYQTWTPEPWGASAVAQAGVGLYGSPTGEIKAAEFFT